VTGDERHLEVALLGLRPGCDGQSGRAVHRHVVHIDVDPVERDGIVGGTHTNVDGRCRGRDRQIVAQDGEARQMQISAERAGREPHLLQPFLVSVSIRRDECLRRETQPLHHQVRAVEAQVELLEREELVADSERHALQLMA
jgi:hypothetical protein